MLISFKIGDKRQITLSHTTVQLKYKLQVQPQATSSRPTLYNKIFLLL